MLEPYNQYDAVAGLEQISHLWLTFIFHENIENEPRLKVRPPRLGGNKKVGVFATRSSFRPNALGQSLVKLERIEIKEKGILLHVLGLDLLSGTPVVDIKPYLPYADRVDDAVNKLAPDAPDLQSLHVHWHPAAVEHLKLLGHGDQVKHWITALLNLDPRPAYAEEKDNAEKKVYGMDVRWQISGPKEALVLSVERLNTDI